MNADTRWKQRFDNYKRALNTLDRAVELSQQRSLSELEQQGLFHCFEFTHELAWKVLKDYLEAQGIIGLIGSRNATREAFKNDLISDGETWMSMINARNQSSHNYNIALATEISRTILSHYYPALTALAHTFAKLLAVPETDL